MRLGVPAGLTEPLPGHERCVLELAATEPVQPGGGSGVGRAQYLRCNLFHNALITLICSTSQLVYLKCKLIPRKFIK